MEEWQQALKWTLRCLTDVQSQQDVELIMHLISTEDFRAAYSVYKAVSQQKSRVSPTSPLTVQAEDLCQEVHEPRWWKNSFFSSRIMLVSCLHIEIQ